MNADLKKVAFLRAGKGRDLVLLHGYLSSKEAFLPLIDYFSGAYRVTAIDFCGFGESEALPYAFSVSDYAEWTENAFYSLGLNHPLCYRPFFRLPRGGENERAGGGNGGGNKDTAAIFRRIR